MNTFGIGCGLRIGIQAVKKSSEKSFVCSWQCQPCNPKQACCCLTWQIFGRMSSCKESFCLYMILQAWSVGMLELENAASKNGKNASCQTRDKDWRTNSRFMKRNDQSDGWSNDCTMTAGAALPVPSCRIWVTKQTFADNTLNTRSWASEPGLIAV